MKEELVAKMESVKSALEEKRADANKSKEEVEADIANMNNIVGSLESITFEYC